MSVNLFKKEDEVVLEVDGVKLELILGFDVALEAEEIYGSYTKFISTLRQGRLLDVAWCFVAVVNQAIKKYNLEYNQSVKPISDEFIFDFIQGENISLCVRTAMELITKSSPKSKNV